MRIAHISDLHVRGLKRHDEYRKLFIEFFNKCHNLKCDAIVVGGDIFHTKTQGITPESIDVLVDFFHGATKACKMYVTLGNHDGNMLNPWRQDAITPIITALNDDNVILIKDSMVQQMMPGYNLCVFSCFDKQHWDNVKPIKGDINIATFHGCVAGGKTDDGWEPKGEVNLDFFDGYDFAFLGDIHSQQFLTDDKRIAYSGNPCQQNFGESGSKGFLLWDIKSAKDFTVELIELTSAFPYVTIDWMGNVSDTIDVAKKYRDNSRFRIKNNDYLNQVDIKQLYSELKHQKKASEIVFKIDKEFDPGKLQTDISMTSIDISNVHTQIKLLHDFYCDENINEKTWKQIEAHVKSYLATIIKTDQIIRNVRWMPRLMCFDNIFSYGKNNIINFDKLNGITGIFAPNRAGKSSIIGAFMYGMFNTSDRGALKNVHIINARKGRCKADIMVSVNAKNYMISRTSERHENKKTGQMTAATGLDFYECDDAGTCLKSLKGLQRSDTDKKIKKLLGSAEDFSLTSLSPQGRVNRFVDEGSSYRKLILARFLGLDIFEKMLEHIRRDSDGLKNEMKNFATRDWDIMITELEEKIKKYRKTVDVLREEVAAHRIEHKALQTELVRLESLDVVSYSKLEEQRKLVEEAKTEINAVNTAYNKHSEVIKKLEARLTKLDKQKKKVDIDAAKQQLDKKYEIEKCLATLRNEYERQLTLQRNQERSVATLAEVPCKNAFPACKFIKQSNEDKRRLSKQYNIVKNVMKQIDASSRKLHDAIECHAEKQIERHSDLEQQEAQIKEQLFKQQLLEQELLRDVERVKENISNKEHAFNELKKKVINTEHVNKLVSSRMKIERIERALVKKDAEFVDASGQLMVCEQNIIRLKQEQDEYIAKRDEWQTFEFLINAFSKHGIPAQILINQLPLINAEISRILHDTCDFTLVFETDEQTNNVDIYIDYGDSRRPIETGSGMEKTIGSLAIRVALLNVSSLPKTNMLIVDEGFGALDETELEACNKFLISLKRFFKHIIIISHIDSVKDIVDDMLEITKLNKDSKITYE